MNVIARVLKGFTKPRGRELVLADGRFARVRPATVMDYLVVCEGGGLTAANLAALVCRVTSIEDRALTMEELFAMELESYTPLCILVRDEFVRAIQVRP